MRSPKFAISLLTLVPALLLGIPASAQEALEPVGQVEVTKTEMGFINYGFSESRHPGLEAGIQGPWMATQQSATWKT